MELRPVDTTAAETTLQMSPFSLSVGCAFSTAVGSLQDFVYMFSPAGRVDECFIRAVYLVVRSMLLPVQMETLFVFPWWVPALFLAEEQGFCSPASSAGSAGARRLAAALRKEPPLWAIDS